MRRAVDALLSLALLLLALLLALLLLATAPGGASWTSSLSSCVQLAGGPAGGACYLDRGAAALPPCLAGGGDAAVARFALQKWFRITDHRRREFARYVARVLPRGRLLQLALDGACANHVDVIRGGGRDGGGRDGGGRWIKLGGNVLRPWRAEDFEELFGPPDDIAAAAADAAADDGDDASPRKINTIVLSASFWSGLTPLMQDQTLRNLRPRMAAYGRILVIGSANPGQAQAMAAPFLRFATRSSTDDAMPTFALRHFSVDYDSSDLDDDMTTYLGILSSAARGARIQVTVATVVPSVAASASSSSSSSSPTALRPLCGSGSNSRLCAAKTYVVNLDRRPARWEQSRKMLSAAGMREGRDFERFAAIDGTSMATLTPDLLHLFRVRDGERRPAHVSNPYDDHGLRRGILGCSLSNLMIWREMLNRADLLDNDFYIVLEDDVWFQPGAAAGTGSVVGTETSSASQSPFLARWKLAYAGVADDDRWDWLYLGFSSDTQTILHGDPFVAPGVVRFRRGVPRSFGGGTFGYAIRKRGARLLLERAQRLGIPQAIDWFMIDTMAETGDSALGHVYKLRPLIVHTTDVLQVDVSDTTEGYPADLDLDRSHREARAAQTRSDCVSASSSSGDSGSGSSGSSGGSTPVLQPLPIIVVAKEAALASSPWIVTRPSFKITTEIEVLQDLTLGTADILDTHKCAKICVAVASSSSSFSSSPSPPPSPPSSSSFSVDRGGAKHTFIKECRELSRSGYPIVVPAPSVGTMHVSLWMEDAEARMLSARNTSLEVTVVDMASVSIANPRPRLPPNQSAADSTLQLPPYVLAESFTVDLSYVINSAAGFAIEEFRPELYQLCGAVSSVHFARTLFPDGVISLGCQPLQPSIGLGKLPYGVHNLSFWLQGVDGASFGFSSDFPVQAVPVMPSPEKLQNDDTPEQQPRLFPDKDDDATGRRNDPEDFDLLVLLYRNKKAFRAALASWRDSGLLALARHKIIFVNGPQLSLQDKAMLLEEYGFTHIIDHGVNVGIGRGLASLVEFDGFVDKNGSTASPLVLFLEEDWVAVTPDKNTTLRNVNAAKQVIALNQAHVVKLRSAAEPGMPYCSSQWKGFEKYMVRPATRTAGKEDLDTDRFAILNAASWMARRDREKVFGPELVWSPAPDVHNHDDDDARQSMVCAHASNCGWTNNPFLARRSFLKTHIVAAAAADWTRSIEGAVNLTPFLWSDRKFRICQMSSNPNAPRQIEGVFSHQDIDKPMELQSPCGQEPAGITRARETQVQQRHHDAAAAVSEMKNATTMLVSVIMPVWNGVAHGYLTSSVMSALQQLPSHGATASSKFMLELICVDDGSRDNTTALLQNIKEAFYASKDPRWVDSAMIVLSLTKNVGLPAALNAGLRQASGTLLTWTSSDNLMAPHMLRELVGAAVLFPEIDFFHGDWDIVEPDTARRSGKGTDPPPDVHVTTSRHDYRTARHLLLEWKGAASFLWRRQPILTEGAPSSLIFDEGLTGCEDVDMWIRVVEASGAKCGVWVTTTDGSVGGDSLAPLYTYRMHGGWATLSMNGKLREVVTKMAKQTVQRHRLSARHLVNPGGQKPTLNVEALFPTLRMCTGQRECLAHAFFLTGNIIARASDREGLRGALFIGYCNYYQEAIRFGGSAFIAARINLAFCNIVVEKWKQAREIARAVFDDVGMCHLSSDITLVTAGAQRQDVTRECKSAPKYATSSHRLTRHIHSLHRVLTTGVVPRWLDLVNERDLGWKASRASNATVIKEDNKKAAALAPSPAVLQLPELLRLERRLVASYKISTAALRLRLEGRHRRVLAVIPSDALSDYEIAGYGSLLRDFYNPLGFFDEVFVLSPRETEERVSHGMYVVPTPSAEALRKHIVQLNVSVVRAYSGYWPATFAVNGRVHGVPVVVSVHDADPELLHADALQHADEIWPVSHAVADRLATHANIPKEQMRMFSNRVDLDVFHTQPGLKPNGSAEKRRAAEYAIARVSALAKQYPGKHRVLFVGRRNRQNNWDTVIRSLADLGPQYTGIFVGRGPKAPMVALAAKLGISRRVHLVESVPNEELKYFYWMADVFCVPSRWEGFGIAFIEAMASGGAVVVTSDIAPMNEFFEHGENGMLVGAFENSMALAHAVKRAATDVKLRKKIRKNARRRAAQRFGKGHVDRWEVGLYRGVLD
jgi:glycosyltransferase involved in cell wall biosynthesis/GR25 family glycosyltransferase involved in LPS biosynthesis